MADRIPEHLVDLLSASIESPARLEVLLLLRRAAPRSFTAKAASKLLHVAESSAERELALLCGRGFLAVKVGSDLNYAYQPMSPELDAHVGAIAKLYDERRADVRALLRREVLDPVRAFAEAFRIVKKGDDDG
jgi:hypothetical protein